MYSFPVLNQSIVPCLVLTVASWPAHRFLRRQVMWSNIPISFRIFHCLFWSTQSKALAYLMKQSWTRLSNFTFTFHFHALEEEMATHSSVLAWRIPGTAGPGGLPSMGSHRVRHDWSDLAAAVAAWSRSRWFSEIPLLFLWPYGYWPFNPWLLCCF